MSKLETNQVDPATGTTLTLGTSGDTISIPSGVTIANSGTATGFGKIGQVITAVDTSSRLSTSTSFVTASSSATINITPSATSSKIYVVCSANIQCNDGNDGWCSTIYRDSTNIGNATSGLASGNSVAGVTTVCFPTTMTILDSPNTTSQVTYQLYVKVIDTDGDGGNVNIGHTISGSSNPVPTHITAFEVLA
jgi:hypothetical protein